MYPLTSVTPDSVPGPAFFINTDAGTVSGMTAALTFTFFVFKVACTSPHL
jgi:hypothetical protein